MLARVVFPVVALVVLFAAGPASAQLDPEAKTPYLWRVVLKAQAHPLLSPTFRKQIMRDLEAALQPALGPLGTVEIIDLVDVPRDGWDPLWQQFEDKGFAALDVPRDLTGTKTHFLKLEYRDGQYQLEARQYDGFAGLASPVLRKQAVRAPELVGRTAGLMLDRDFGLSGTVEPVIGRVDEVKVTVRASQLGSIDRFVKVGDVFGVSQVSRTNRPAPPVIRTATGKIIAPPPGSVPPPGLTAKPWSHYTLLKVNEVGKDGVLRCASLTRLKNGIPTQGNAAGYRCMKLGTVDGPLTVRLVSSDGSAQKAAGLVTVRATEGGFGIPPDARDTLDFRDGLFRSARPLSNVACITVSIGPTQSRLFPVPVLGPEPVNLEFAIDPKAEERAAFERAALAAAARVIDARNAQTICFEATAKFIEKQKNAEALARAKGGFKAAEEADKSISDELALLKEQADKSPDGGRLLKAVEQHLNALRQFNVQLATHVKTLETVVARENDPTSAAREVQAQALGTRINVLLGRGEIEEAIAAYDQLSTLLPDDASVKTRRDKLKAEWVPKNPAHAKARDYLLKTWPGVATIPDFRDSLAELGTAVDECMKNGDRHALRKLLVIFSGALVKLNELAAPLDTNADADRKLLADAKKAGEVLASLETKIQDFVKKGE